MSKKIIITIALLLLAVSTGGYIMMKKVEPYNGLLRDVISTISTVGSFQLSRIVNTAKQVPEQLSEAKNDIPAALSNSNKEKITGNVVLRVGVFSDSHGYKDEIVLALNAMKEANVDVVLHLGDFTAGGEDKYFAEAKEALDASGLPYYVLPGDHDFNWYPELSRKNFEKYFNNSYNQVISKNGVALIMYENSSNADDSEANQEWLEKQIDLYKSKSNILIFSHRPFYSPYFPTKQDPHGDEIISQLKASGVRYVFAGNTHVFAKYKDYSEELNLVTVGAVGQYKNPLPQWVLVEISDKNEVVVDPQPLIDL